MEQAAEKLDFEHAATYRNRLWALAHVQADQAINSDGIEEADIFAAHQDGRTDLHPGVLLPRRPELGQSRVLSQGRPQHRSRRGARKFHRAVLRRQAGAAPDPGEPRIPDARVDGGSAFHQDRAQRSKSQHPSGARSAISSRWRSRTPAKRSAASSPTPRPQTRLLAALGEAFGLERPPRRVEVYDNSHIMGTNAVGGMMVAGPDGFIKGPLPYLQHQHRHHRGR
jgi:excinuclease ABC subunit C